MTRFSRRYGHGPDPRVPSSSRESTILSALRSRPFVFTPKNVTTAASAILIPAVLGFTMDGTVPMLFCAFPGTLGSMVYFKIRHYFAERASERRTERMTLETLNSYCLKNSKGTLRWNAPPIWAAVATAVGIIGSIAGYGAYVMNVETLPPSYASAKTGADNCAKIACVRTESLGDREVPRKPAPPNVKFVISGFSSPAQ